MWNMDETRFWIGCEKDQWIVTMNPNKPFCMINPKNRDYIILAECIGFAGAAYVAGFQGQQFTQVVAI